VSAASARVHDWMWVAPSGRRIAPAELADHITTAGQLLQRDGWDAKEFGIDQAVNAGEDRRTVAYRFIEHQLGVEISVPFADLWSWERSEGRTRDDVIGLMDRTARMVRELAAIA
jgi:hypothetical protein